MSDESRPDPDALLARVQAEEGHSAAGRLKVFFGYSAGVGKTYAMLEAARALEIKRAEVLVGYIEPHGRPETEALLLGLEILPFKQVDYRGVRLREFDLDEALRRKPRLILIDELAHTNADGSRHPKRWQDVLELLDAGISVYTTINVQHVESLNDVVGKVSGISVRETVPDTVLDRADEIEVVDLPPAELLERFREGKVYLPDQARLAADRFFRKETLVALRELALRKAAEHVNRQVELGRRGLAARPIWSTRERLMVAVGPAPTSAKLVRAARRMAAELRCPWHAIAVEPTTRPPGAAQGGLEANLRLAERLGAEVATVQGDSVADALLRFAHDRGVSRLLIGKTARPWWWRLSRGDIVDEIIRKSGDVEILVIRGDNDPALLTPPPNAARPPARDPSRPMGGPADTAFSEALIVSTAMVLATGAGMVLQAVRASEANIVLVYLLAVAIVAYTSGRIAAIASAVLAMLLFNFFFTQPYYSLAFNDSGYAVTFGVMLVIGLAISGLVRRVRAQADAARQRADASEILSRVSRRLAGAAGHSQAAADLLRVFEEDLHLEIAIFLASATSTRFAESLGAVGMVDDPRERGVAEWAMQRAQEAGSGTDTLPDSGAWYLPMVASDGTCLGVIAIKPAESGIPRERRRLARSIASVAAQAFERERLAEKGAEAAMDARTERLRSDLLAAVSHDLRTPLASISGATSAILASRTSTLSDADRELARDALHESERLTRLVENLLQLGRLDDGKLAPRADWHSIDEIAGAALKQVARTGDTTRIRIALPDSPLLAWADDSLVTQAAVNLLENSLKYAPAGDVVLSAARTPTGVRLQVSDSGPGFPPGDTARLFHRFTRGEPNAVRGARGSGLGLAICRAVAEAHGGSISASNLSAGGALVTLDLPDPPGIARPPSETEAGNDPSPQPPTPESQPTTV